MSKFRYDGRSTLVDNMSAEADELEQFPVLVGTEIAYFHEVSGGYDRKTSRDVVNFVHRVRDVGSPNRTGHAESIEAHLDNFYNLDVADVRKVGDYPDENYVLSVLVEDYMFGEYSFSDALTSPVDKREEEINYEEQ